MEDKRIKSFRDLRVWLLGVDIVEKVYILTKKFPKDETFGLSSQIRRSAVSTPSNIAEGRSRGSKKEFCQFLFIALGSSSELETQLIITNKLYSFLEIDEVICMIQEEQKMISSLISKLKS